MLRLNREKFEPLGGQKSLTNFISKVGNPEQVGEIKMPDLRNQILT